MKKRENAVLKYCKYSKDFIEHSNGADDIYENNEEKNSNEKLENIDCV